MAGSHLAMKSMYLLFIIFFFFVFLEPRLRLHTIADAEDHGGDDKDEKDQGVSFGGCAIEYASSVVAS